MMNELRQQRGVDNFIEPMSLIDVLQLVTKLSS